MSTPTPRTLSQLPELTVLDTSPDTTDILLVRQDGIDKRMSANKLATAGGDITVTGDEGGSITGDDFDLFGQKAGTNTHNVSVIVSGSTVNVEARAIETAYIVDSSTVAGKRGTFTTIQAAITAIVADGMASSTRTGTIILRGLNYTENVTIPANIRLTIKSAGGRVGCSWQGTIANSAARLTLIGIEFYNGAGNTLTNPGLGNITLHNCNANNVAIAGGTLLAINSYVADWACTGGQFLLYGCELSNTLSFTAISQISCYNCYGNNLTMVFNTSGAGNFYNCSGLVLTGTTTGVFNLTNCSLRLGINMPSASIYYSSLSADTGINLPNMIIAAFIYGMLNTMSGNVYSARRISSDTTVTKFDQYVGVTGNATAVSITMSTTGVTKNQEFIFADEAGTANTKNINITGVTINGFSGFNMSEPYQIIKMVYDGTNFIITSNTSAWNFGNVEGPASATNLNFAAFDGTSGKEILDSGVNASSFLTPGNNLLDVSSVPTARANLGLAIGTNVQAYDATLQSISALGTATDKIAYTTGVDTWAESTITAFARTLLADATNSAARTTLGLGTAAVQNISAFLQTSNNLSDLLSASTARTNLGLGTAAVQNVATFLQTANNLSDVASAATAFANISPLTSKGDLITRSSSVPVILPVGANGTILRPDSTAASGLAWSTATYPATTTANRLLYSSGNDVVAELPTANNAVVTTNGTGVPSVDAANFHVLTTGVQMKGNNTNTAPPSGFIGQQVRAMVALGAAVTIPNGGANPTNVTNISLDPGIWDITALVVFTGSVTGTNFSGSITATSAAFGTFGDSSLSTPTAPSASCDSSITIANFRVLVPAGGAVYYMTAYGAYTVGTLKAYGRLSAVRPA